MKKDTYFWGNFDTEIFIIGPIVKNDTQVCILKFRAVD